jgi:hypothetical protein
MVRRTLLTGLAAVLATAALAGCSGSTKPPTEAPTGPASPSIPAPPTATPSTPAPGSSGGTGGGAGAVALCKLSDLTVTAGEGGAGAGHWGLPLVFRNKGTATCRLVGYPGVAGLDAGGNQLAQARRTASGYLGGLVDPQGRPPVVDIGPGAAASAYLEGSNVWVHDASECPVYQGLLVTPPDETHSVRLTLTANGCNGLQIHPVVPGDTGSQQR